jgi:hypothetical protein
VDKWLDELDPATTPSRDASCFRAIIEAQSGVEEAQARLRKAVLDARAAGDSWAVIGAALGVSRQAAWERFGSE